jgi:splicing factor 3A subunit 1
VRFIVPLCTHILFLTCVHTAIIDRTATFVVKSANPTHFEDRIRENQRQDPKFSFLHPADPYHAYYRDRLEKVAKGDVEDDDAPKEGKGPADQPVEKPVVDVGKEPPAPQFILDWPNISAVDLCVFTPYCHSTQLTDA